ncbi:T9SS type A sorting domain-containing protein [Hymenobacter sp. NST-14]|uniref:T9SS type A sorting domain-containing protein n=1 Tax=Hymenobacter piscis TaxID=2839984 RepID=UPI001C026C17|nr:T9SS type A sorting domain-containing protein [Hymenobacter piscis]MBT9393541.1 T9SS type A sorting domain-containing protein [Hymenobacter piscis]
MEFQIKLYEAGNTIEFVYGNWTSSGNTAVGRGFYVGLKGASAELDDISLAYKASSASAWTTTVFQNTVTTPSGLSYAPHFVRNTFLPDPGRTYRFRSPATDAAVAQTYTLGKLPIPAGAPHVIRALVINTGITDLTNLTVTAAVSGANTFSNTQTVASLGIGDSAVVAFAPFTPTATGTNTVTVSIPTDDNQGNNTATYPQQVNTTTFAYARPGVAETSSVGFGSGSGILATKYTSSVDRTVTGVTVRLQSANAVGNTVYAVVTSPAGNIIARSLDYVVTSDDIGKDKSFALNGNISAGDFLVGLAQTAGAAAYFPVAVQGQEDPARTDAYFVLPLAGGTPEDVADVNLGAFMIEAVTSPVVTCPPPTAVTLTAVTTTSVVVTFSGPANATGYSIVYGPRGFDPTTAGTTVAATASPFTLTGLTNNTEYDVYVRANCSATDRSAFTGPLSFKTVCEPPVIAAFPYAQNFDSVLPGAIPCGITVADNNNDGKTWTIVGNDGAGRFPASAPNQIRYAYSATNAADDWFYTNPLALKAGTTYLVSFKYRGAQPSNTEKLEVKYGTAATAASQTTLLWQNEAITNAEYATAVAGTAAGQVLPITPTADGNYYVGFHAYSAANQFNLYVDDVTVTAAAVTSSSKALLQAITLYPNPTAGNLTVDVRGVSAKNGLQVEVTNMLGQRVHTETVRSNGTTQVDLSDLANGLYTVKVRNGNEYMVRSIAIQK